MLYEGKGVTESVTVADLRSCTVCLREERSESMDEKQTRVQQRHDISSKERESRESREIERRLSAIDLI